MNMNWLGTSVARGRFGGVVGKVTLMFGVVASMAAFALWGVGASTPAALVAGGIVLVAGLVAVGILYFAHLHPDLALLEGSQWLAYQDMIQSKGSSPQLPRTSGSLTLEAEPGEVLIEGDEAELKVERHE